ncbi:MAG: acyl-CoA thioesterase [Acidibrevibacterium sp.]|jgi:4-hydroxybenzoyl-CoA thioesterase|uniref:acyl-CoA thioesterase n=1 Tax=Acidibrevibacterium fodinaquatile TaxID=1969806 RepID=UPI000E0CE4FE|nr:thioesterase family protein [Acidibrevibacterium fodinaquatile]MCA7118685.1 acyl-CoA thioesterase [Acidibrevibacterium fodinaquatile]
MFVNTMTRLIEWGDCDPAGIVFYPRYFAMFDTATALLFQAALGIDKAAMLARFGIAGFPMVDTRARFLTALSFGATVRIESSVTALGRSSFGIRHALFDGEACAVEGEETRVWTRRDPEGPKPLRAAPIPDEVRACLARSR